MRQEAVRKLRHRIAAGLLCCSIIIAGQPNRTGLSRLQAAETESRTEENLNLWTEEDRGLIISAEEDPADMPNGADVNENNSGIPEEETGMSEVQGSTEPVLEEGQTEAIPEEASANSRRSETGLEMETGSVITDAVLSAEPRNVDTHQHSVSTDCSVNTGKQVTFTELNTTGGILPEGNYYLSNDIELDHTLEITSGTVHLCLNGHILRYSGAAKARVIEVSNAVLNVCDCREDGCITEGTNGGIELNNAVLCLYGGSITKNMCLSTDQYDNNHIGGGINMKDSTLTIYGGSISDNSADGGGGVYAYNSDIILRDGAIEGNHAYDKTDRLSIGGGIVLATSCTFVMYGGKISNNTSERWGAAISAPSSAASRSSLSIYGGEISGNISQHGGIIIVSQNDFKMTGGSIINNQFYGDADNDGALEFTNASIELSGNPIIRNNFLGDHVECNLNLVSNSNVTITDALTAGADIGITYQSGIVITSNPFAVPVKDGKEIDIRQYIQYFSSDAEGYGILYQDGRATGKPEGLYLSRGINIFYDYETNGGNSVSLASAFAESFRSLDLSPDAENAVVAAKSGWEFLGWNTDSDATEALENLMTGRESITLYAIYKKTITASFYSGSEKQKADKTITIYNNETEGIVKTPPLEVMPGWQAVGWDISVTEYAGGISAGTDIPVSEDCDYYGIYEQPVMISYNANGGTAAPGEETKKRFVNVHKSITYQNPTVILAPAVTKAGYTFTGWRQENSGAVKHPGYTVELTGNTTFYADWMVNTEHSYVVEYYWQNVTGNGYSRIDTIPCTGTAGTTVEAEVRTYTGFTENPEHVSRIPSGVIVEDGSLVLRLYYDRNVYTICFDLNGAEGTAPAAQNVRYGGCAGAVLNPVRDGYTFTGWYMEQAGTYSLWDFADTVENNIQNSQNARFGQSRRAENTTVILYAGWSQNQSDNDQSNDNTTEDTAAANTSGSGTASDTTDFTTEGKSSTGSTSASVPEGQKKTVPGTGDASPIQLYATAAMAAGLSYLMLEFTDKADLTEEKKRLLTARLIQWAKKGGVFRRLAAALIIFLLLVYYYTIGRQLMFQHSFSEKY